MTAQIEKFPLKKKGLLLHIDVVIFKEKKSKWRLVNILHTVRVERMGVMSLNILY